MSPPKSSGTVFLIVDVPGTSVREGKNRRVIVGSSLNSSDLLLRRCSRNCSPYPFCRETLIVIPSDLPESAVGDDGNRRHLLTNRARIGCAMRVLTKLDGYNLERF